MRFSFIASIVVKRFLFNGVFTFGKSKKSARAESGEYDGWGMITVLFLAKNSRISTDVWAGALSWCNIHDWFFHNSVSFWRIALHNRRITSRWYFLLTVRTTLWQEIMMDHAIAIEENIKQNLQIRPNFTFDRTIPAVVDAFIGMIRLWFHCYCHTLMISYQLQPFSANLDRRWTPLTSPDRCPCDIVFTQKFCNFITSTLPIVSWLKHP